MQEKMQNNIFWTLSTTIMCWNLKNVLSSGNDNNNGIKLYRASVYKKYYVFSTRNAFNHILRSKKCKILDNFKNFEIIVLFGGYKKKKCSAHHSIRCINFWTTPTTQQYTNTLFVFFNFFHRESVKKVKNKQEDSENS